MGKILKESLQDFTTHSGDLNKVSLNFWIQPDGTFIRIPMQGHNTWASQYVQGWPDKYRERLLTMNPQNVLYRENWIKAVLYDVWDEPIFRIEHSFENPPNHVQERSIYKFVQDFNADEKHEQKIKYIQDDTKRTRIQLEESTNLLNEWHEHAKLEAYVVSYEKQGWRFWFFRNGLLSGEIQHIDPNGYVMGFGVQRSLQGTGLGKSMLNYAFEKTGLSSFTLDTTSANAFYHKIGGERDRKYGTKIPKKYGTNGVHYFTIRKEKLKSSPFQFQDIDASTANKYINRVDRFDPWPSINENILKIDERLTFADLYGDTDDERIFKSKLPGMRVRPMTITMENGNETWNFGYTSNEKSQYKRHGGKVGHNGRIIFFKDSVEPNDNAEDLECMVDCDCKDFQYRFAYVNAKDDASVIGPNSLNKATNAPPVKTNPEGHQQLCKHLAALVKYLVTNIERARQRAHLRGKPMNIFEAMDEITNRRHDQSEYYDKDESLTETRIINPDESLGEGYITLYHGTIWPIALKAKKGELGPQDLEKLLIDVLVNVFHETPKDAKIIYDREMKTHSIRKEPDKNVLFFTTSKKGAEGYAKSCTKYGGEIFLDVLGGYLWEKDKHQDYKEKVIKYLQTDEPAIVTVNVPLSMVLTHPNWKTPFKERIRGIMKNIRKNPELGDILKDNFNMEVFVKEKIPARFVQRIDRVEGK